MEDKLKEIMSKVFLVEKKIINSKTSPENLENWDSMNHLNLVIELENEFNINLDNDQIVSITNFSELVKLINSLK